MKKVVDAVSRSACLSSLRGDAVVDHERID
jgi:hypothetical protein